MKSLKLSILTLSLIVAGTVFAPQKALADGSQENTNISNHYSELYIVKMQSTENGQWLEYIYSPNIILSQGLLDALNDVLSEPYKGLMPAVVNEQAAALFNYVSNDVPITAAQAANTDWTNFLYIINNIVPGEIVQLNAFDHNTGEFVNIPQLQSTINNDYVKTDSYRFLTQSVSSVEFVYIDGVLTPITTNNLTYDNVDIKTISLIKEVLVTGIDNVSAGAGAIVGYYDMMGRKLQEEPTTGLYIIKYDNGATKQVMR